MFEKFVIKIFWKKCCEVFYKMLKLFNFFAIFTTKRCKHIHQLHNLLDL